MSGLYVLMLSVHGLLRAEQPELGVDADTGGQTLYVLELARALGRNPAVDRVDLLTRLIEDPRVAPGSVWVESGYGATAPLLAAAKLEVARA